LRQGAPEGDQFLVLPLLALPDRRLAVDVLPAALLVPADRQLVKRLTTVFELERAAGNL